MNIDRNYVDGFIKACELRGVDPEQVLKYAAGNIAPVVPAAPAAPAPAASPISVPKIPSGAVTPKANATPAALVSAGSSAGGTIASIQNTGKPGTSGPGDQITKAV